jgi:hypothetical protein
MKRYACQVVGDGDMVQPTMELVLQQDAPAVVVQQVQFGDHTNTALHVKCDIIKYINNFFKKENINGH